MKLQRILVIYILSLALACAFILVKNDNKNLSQIFNSLQNGQTMPLPDLAPLAIYDLRLSKLNSRSILKFSASFVNKGRRQFELIGDPSVRGDGYRNVYQHIAKEDGS